jgi:hypothetical protein
MLRRRSEKRTVALIAAVLLLLCQVAFAAQACARYATAGADAIASCHHSAADADSTEPATVARSSCESPALAAEGVSLPLVAVTAFASVAIAPALAITLPSRERAALATATPCHPPPLTVLHCRFLN